MGVTYGSFQEATQVTPLLLGENWEYVLYPFDNQREYPFYNEKALFPSSE
jgi:hypothetical protein